MKLHHLRSVLTRCVAGRNDRHHGKGRSVILLLVTAVAAFNSFASEHGADEQLDRPRGPACADQGFKGKIQSTLTDRLGRPLERANSPTSAELIFFDNNTNGLHDDNSFAGLPLARVGFGDAQSIAIGIDNNGIVARSQGRATSGARPGRQHRLLPHR